MSKQYDDTNKGAIWGNKKRETEKHPHFTGQANIDGVEYWVSAWKRGDNDAENAPALRFAFTPKDEAKAKPKQKEMAHADPDLDDEIPF